MAFFHSPFSKYHPGHQRLDRVDVMEKRPIPHAATGGT
ncbi:hypothetical protein Z945_468 [Sulfitobacter noctilucae]|nr:hypothetical protein Z945_468 [Sulfitobacter noctilucae]